MTQSSATTNILLVDDRPENLFVLELVLEDLKQNLVKANSGQEALHCLQQQDFAVILLDVQMPGMDGFETAALIRQQERSHDTPIIFLTAFSASNQLVSRGYSLGAVDYLLKPIDPTILATKVSAFVELFKKTLEVKRQATQLTAMNIELKRSEERFRTLSACSPVGVFLTDATNSCTYSNPACQAICGVRLEENWDINWANLVHPDDSDRVFAKCSACRSQGEAYSDEFRIQTSDGGMRWVHIRTAPILSDQDELLGHVGTIEDISDRKQAETVRDQMIREQVARQQAEAANRMKDEFLAVVSHELRTPLSSILGWSRLLLTRKFDQSTTQRALETIERNARSQAQLIEDILDVSQIIQGKLRINRYPIDWLALIDAIVETFRPLANAKQIDLDAILDPAAQLVCGDPERLQQIIWNLLSNAIKFTPDHGKVEIRLSKGMLPSPYAQLQIIDSGIGIKPEFLPYVFDRFRQADSTLTRPYGGLGLGLAIVHHLVDLHDGEITATSDGDGKGATCTVRLPLVARIEADQSNNGHPGHPPSLEHVHVLVAEDNADTCSFIKLVLEQSGAEVTTVTSPTEAMQCLQTGKPQVLISTIRMLEADDYWLMHQIQFGDTNSKAAIPAIALTTQSDDADRLQAMELGFQIHIPKPIEPTTLVTAIANLIQHSSSLGIGSDHRAS